MDHRETPEAKLPVPGQEIGPEAREAGPEGERVPRPAERPRPAEAEAAPAFSVPAALPAAPAAPAKDAYHQRVERVLEDGLEEIYLKLPKERRQAFRDEGERVSSQLRTMLDSARIRAKDVLKLIAGWLAMIPGVSRWFLEQEAKIKTDRIVQLAEERRREREGL